MNALCVSFLVAVALSANFVYGSNSISKVLGNHVGVPNQESDIITAFASDGWDIADKATSKNGFRGYYAESKTATILSNGKPKKSYYVEGEAWDMGWLHGVLSARNGDAKAMCTTYVHHIILNLLDETFDEEMAAKCEGWTPGDTVGSEMDCATYESLLKFLDTWLISGSVHSFYGEISKFPPALITEMKAFVDGAVSEDPDCGCTYDKIIYLNYGIDYIMSALYAGTLPHVLSKQATKSGLMTAEQVENIRQLPHRAFKVPYYCNSFGAAHGATAAEGDVFMSRDFQLPTGLVYQDVAADMVFVPTDGRNAHVSSGAPGFIGRMTVMNSLGVSMGVDMLRAAPNSPEAPGLNSIILMRVVADSAMNTSHAVEIVASAERGTTWLYPICDGEGDCVVIEAGKYLPPGEAFNPLQYVDSKEVRNALPSEEFFQTHSSDDIFDRGMYARPMDWTYPTDFLSYNEGLFALAGVEYDESVWGEVGYVFPDYETENEVTKKSLHNNFYPPQRETYKDLMLISNNAIVPEFRTSMMSYADNFWESTAHGAQWRYDEINYELTKAYGSIDMEAAIRITSYLSPLKTPGYWTNTINESDPMSAIVEGTMNVVHNNKLKFATKTGYWADDWTFITLSGFLS